MTATTQESSRQHDDEGVEIAKRRASEGKRAEARLGVYLVAPAAVVMIAVTAYPILYAIYLSLFKADLRTPDANEFVGLSNYVTVLSSSIWWTAFGITMLITVVSTFFELVLGMVLAIVMHRTLVGRGLVRTSALVPYAIVTVVAAVFTPPDAISMVSLAVPMIALYEISIWLAKSVEKKRAAEEATTESGTEVTPAS